MGGFTTGRIGSVFVDIEGDLSKLDAAMRAAVPDAEKVGQKIGAALSSGTNRGLEQLGNSIGSLSNSMAQLGTVLTVGVTAPMVAFGAQAVSAAADIDSLKRGLVAITGSSAEAERQFDSLREVAKLPGLGLEEAVRGSINLQAFGMSAMESKDALMAFGNAIGSVGKGRAELDRVILQLGQMAGAGKVLLQDLRPIIQTVPQVSQIIREQFGPEALSAPAETLEKLGINSREFIQILVRELGKLPQVTSGIKNALENLSDSTKIALANVGDSMTPIVEAISNRLGPALVGLSQQWKDLPGLVQNTALAFGGFAASVPPAILTIAGVGKGLEAFIDIAGKARTGLRDLEKSYGDWAKAGTQATESVDGLSGAIGGATGGAVGNVGLFKTAVTDLVGGLSGGQGLMTALGVAGTAMLSFGAAALATEGNILSMEKQVSEAADEIRKLQILSFVDQGKLEELKKLGIGLDEIKAAMVGATQSFDKGKESALVLEGAQRQLAKSGLIIIDGNKKLAESSEQIIKTQAEANAAVLMAKTTYEDLAAALKRGDANVSIEAVNRAYIQWQKTIKDANPTIKEAATSTLDLGEKYERLAQRFRDGRATAQEVAEAYDKLVTSQRALGRETGFTTDDLKKQAEAFKELAGFAPHVSEALKAIGATGKEISIQFGDATLKVQTFDKAATDQATAVAKWIEEHKKLGDAVGAATDKYRGFVEAQKAGLLPQTAVKEAAKELREALKAAHPDIAETSFQFKQLLTQAGLAADGIETLNQRVYEVPAAQGAATEAVREAQRAYEDAVAKYGEFSAEAVRAYMALQEASRGVNKESMTSITVFKGSGDAAREAGNAFRDMGAGARKAADDIINLNGEMVRLKDLAAKVNSDQTGRGTPLLGPGEWPGPAHLAGSGASASSGGGKTQDPWSKTRNDLAQINNNDMMNGSSMEGMKGQSVSVGMYLSMLKMLGATEDSIDRAAVGFGLMKAGEGNYMTPEELASFSVSFGELGSNMRVANQAVVMLDGTIRQFGVNTGMTADEIRKADRMAMELGQKRVQGEIDAHEATQNMTRATREAQERMNEIYDTLRDLTAAGMQGSDQFQALQREMMGLNASLNNGSAVFANATGWLNELTSKVTDFAGSAAMAATNVLAAAVQIKAALPQAGVKAVGPTIMPTVPTATTAAGGGAAGGSLVNVGNGRLQWVPPGGVNLNVNVNGGTFSSTAFVNEVGAGLIAVLGRDVGVKL